MIERMTARLRRMLLAAAGNVSLFVTTAFFVTGLLILGPDVWWREHIDMFERYVLIPWGMALCLLRLERRVRAEQDGMRWDLAVLFLLLAWIVVPFAVRFGNTFNNSGSWHNHTVVFFGIYALTTEEEPVRRERMFDLAALLFALCSLVLGAALLYCVAEVKKFGDAQFAFGVCDGIYLCANGHYNNTGMLAVCCALMALAGACRFRNRPLRLLCAVSVIMMTLVTVLTQSRTARYALIAAYAVMVFSEVLCTERIRRTAVRSMAAVLAACVTAAACYGGAAVLTDAAVAHYNRAALAAVEQPSAKQPSAAPDTDKAESTAAQEEKASVQESTQKQETDAQLYEARAAADASFSGRTAIWRNLINHWRENPKYLLIGQGIGRIGHLVTEGTIHENRESVSIHNTYLQFIADYGLIAFVLLCAFFALIAAPVSRVFTARGSARRPGYGALGGILASCLLTGMMESTPLGAMTPMNMMLFFSLALLFARGRDIRNDG
ncbi:MAG: O-antigen ligase family protein [Candidatus Ventricola sp.]